MRPGPDAPPPGSGPRVARLFHRLLGAVSLVAWISLGVQVHALIGSRGLLPAAELFGAGPIRAAALSEFPSWLRFAHGDVALTLGVVAGGAASLSALLGFFPRVAFAVSTVLYLGYALACRDFLAFQWDNLLIECGALAVFLPADRPARWVHVLFRLVLFKLYFESGVAKWQSHLGDWHAGSAMTYYYETAPLPTALAWLAHRLPAGWHHLESWGTLAFELAVPFLIFGPRRARLAAFAVLTAFQVVNLSTANYGFFCYLALALHAFLLDDGDVARAGASARRALARARRRLGPAAQALRRAQARARMLRRRRLRTEVAPPSARADLVFLGRLTVAALVAFVFVAASLAGAMRSFWRGGPELGPLTAVARAVAPFRAVNTYHLFGHITRERIEPELQVLRDGAWQPLDLRYKPGDPSRAPPLVAPHQPRVDFRLWFYGLSFRRGTPLYVQRLLERLCHDPDAIAGLFARPPPEGAEAARVVFWDYRFTTAEELRSSGRWWRRRSVGRPLTVACRS